MLIGQIQANRGEKGVRDLSKVPQKGIRGVLVS